MMSLRELTTEAERYANAEMKIDRDDQCASPSRIQRRRYRKQQDALVSRKDP